MARRRFKKIYVEITSACNLRCSFCPPTGRAPQLLSEERFTVILEQIRGLTDLLFFHVKGEPLLHPHLGALLDRAGKAGLKVDLVTNGTLIERALPLVDHPALHKFSVSLHSFSGPESQVEGYLAPILDLAEVLSKSGKTCVLRFWRVPDPFLVQALEARWGATLPPQVFVHHEREFVWPSLEAPLRGSRGFCLGLRDQIGVLVDGTVVPCCLDGEGVIALGNLFEQPLQAILEGPRAQALYDGFSQERCVEPLCQHCGFRAR